MVGRRRPLIGRRPVAPPGSTNGRPTACRRRRDRYRAAAAAAAAESAAAPRESQPCGECDNLFLPCRYKRPRRGVGAVWCGRSGRRRRVMAFMVPVVKKEWDIYGSSAKGRRERAAQQQREAGRSRTVSETSQPASCPAAAGGWPVCQRGSRCSSRGSNLSAQTACSPPSRGVTFSAAVPARRRRSGSRSGGAPTASPPQSAPGSFSGFHTKVVDRMMRALHISDRQEESRRS